MLSVVFLFSEILIIVLLLSSSTFPFQSEQKLFLLRCLYNGSAIGGIIIYLLSEVIFLVYIKILIYA